MKEKNESLAKNTACSSVGVPLVFMKRKRGAKEVIFTYDVDDWTAPRWTDKEGNTHTLLELLTIFSKNMKSYNGYIFNLRQWCEKKKYPKWLYQEGLYMCTCYSILNKISIDHPELISYNTQMDCFFGSSKFKSKLKQLCENSMTKEEVYEVPQFIYVPTNVNPYSAIRWFQTQSHKWALEYTHKSWTNETKCSTISQILVLPQWNFILSAWKDAEKLQKKSYNYPPTDSQELSDSSYHSSNEQHDVILQGGVWHSELKSGEASNKDTGRVIDKYNSDISSTHSKFLDTSKLNDPSSPKCPQDSNNIKDPSSPKHPQVLSPHTNSPVPISSLNSLPNIIDSFPKTKSENSSKLDTLSSKILEREEISSKTYVKNFPLPQIMKSEMGPKRKRNEKEKEQKKRKKIESPLNHYRGPKSVF